MALDITRMMTSKNYTASNKNRKIAYLVIHWVGAVSSAKNNAKYFQSYRGASAHYFVDNNSIYQIIDDWNIAWHCGTKGKYFHKSCRNSNSIGIEMCLDKPGHISDETIARTAKLVQTLMIKYGIPASNVIRHYDVTHKSCPGCFIKAADWNPVHAILTSANSHAVEDVTPSAPVQSVTAPSAKAKTVNKYGVVDVSSGDTLNIRISPSSKAAKLSGYNKGLSDNTVLYIYKEENGWYYVSNGAGAKGWVSDNYVVTGFMRTVATRSGNLNMRAGRGTGYGILKSIPKGTVITVLKTYSNGWAKVIYDYAVGYVNASYLK